MVVRCLCILLGMDILHSLHFGTILGCRRIPCTADVAIRSTFSRGCSFLEEVGESERRDRKWNDGWMRSNTVWLQARPKCSELERARGAHIDDRKMATAGFE